MGQEQNNMGDTTLTKVFVGGLAWEMQKEALRVHFYQYGEILEAVIISDKLTGRSKGYGFVTFKDPESAKRACEDANPVINGRRSNCNLASLGSRRRPSPTHQTGMGIGGPRAGLSSGPPAPWYYHRSGTPPPYHHHYTGVAPYYPAPASYGYSPSYMADLAYSTPTKLSHPQRQFSYPTQGGVAAPNAMVPVYPMYHFHHHQNQGMGVPTHFFPSKTTTAAAAAATTRPIIISKPNSMPPAKVCLAVEQVTSCS